MGLFTCEKVTPAITRIRDGSDVCCYLISGKQRAILVDTSYGIGNLRKYVESLTTLPYSVIITHGHVDHASGAGQFDTVYMSNLDLQVCRERCAIKARIQALSSHGKKSLLDAIDAGEPVIQPKTNGFLPLDEGMIFSLGGITLEAIHVPGHTPGMIVLLDQEERIALFGDACGVFTMLVRPEASSVASYYKSLLHLKTFEPLYDRVLRQHGTCESPCSILESNIELCAQILSGTDDAFPLKIFGQNCLAAKRVRENGMRLDGKEGNVIYRKDRVS